MQASKIHVDVEGTLGKVFWLCEIRENWEYAEGKKTGNFLGYRYIVACPELALERVSVKIPGAPGKPLVELPEGELVEVSFSGLEASVYVQNGTVGLSAKADSIAVVNPKKG